MKQKIEQKSDYQNLARLRLTLNQYTSGLDGTPSITSVVNSTFSTGRGSGGGGSRGFISGLGGIIQSFFGWLFGGKKQKMTSLATTSNFFLPVRAVNTVSNNSVVNRGGGRFAGDLLSPCVSKLFLETGEFPNYVDYKRPNEIRSFDVVLGAAFKTGFPTGFQTWMDITGKKFGAITVGPYDIYMGMYWFSVKRSMLVYS